MTLLLIDCAGGARRPAVPVALPDRQHIQDHVASYGGAAFEADGGALGVAFPSPAAAAAAACAIQQANTAAADHPPAPLRMALHIGPAYNYNGRYYGPAPDRATHLLAAGHNGQILLSRAAVDQLDSALPAGTHLVDLGMHRLPDLLRPEQIFQLVSGDAQPAVPALTTMDNYPHNLPIQATSLIGRRQQIAEICATLLQPDVRMLTLTGMGGMGKTRLALHASALLLDAFPDGVYVVALSSITDSQLVAGAIAQALGIMDAAEQQLSERLVAELRGKHMLLLLDNFEHLLDAAPTVSELLSAAPGLKALITSRAALHLYGEREYAVPPLTLPDLKQHKSLHHHIQSEAVQLFIERAQAVKTGFTLTPASAAAIIEICRSLDGLPLAIELAAARSKLFPPARLRDCLAQRLKLLTGGARDLPARQQSLRNTIAWSYDLLTADERTMFARLGVFAGSFTLEAAQAVCGDVGLEANADHTPHPIELVASLFDKSLLQQEDLEEEPRFRMLETIRAYALEQLETQHEAGLLNERHAAYYCAFSEQAEAALQGPQRGVWLRRIENEHDNLRAALRWAIQHERADLAGQLAASLWPFWYARGYISEGRTWIELALSNAQAVPAALRSRLLNGAATLAIMQGDYPRAHAFLAQSLETDHWQSDTRSIITLLNSLGTIATHQGNYELAQSHYAESQSLARSVGDQRLIAGTLGAAGLVALYQGRYREAQSLYQESLELLYELGATQTQTITRSLTEMGMVARYQGNYAHALALHEESLTLDRELGYMQGIARTLVKMGTVARLQGDLDRARAAYEEGLELAGEIGDQLSIAEGLEGLASSASARGQIERAVLLWGAAAAVRDAISAPLPPADRAEYDRLVASARTTLGLTAFAAAWASGRAMTPEQIQALPEPEHTRAAPRAAAPAYPADLTEREVEVLQLIARGLTDAQVAEQLVISPRTVNSHLRTIYSKIQVTSRTAAARFAYEYGLA